MRYSQYFLPTLKETPADAEVVSHKLMLRAGMIRKVAAGIYSYLPLGLRSLRKVERIVREEMDRAGAIEIHMPMVVPAELWEETGRWDFYGKELLRLKDRKDASFCLGPTHEEVVTDIARRELQSYKQLPVNLYQIQTKFRDEIRPRFGLMRGREFVMKDAYSFDLDPAGLDLSYQKMYAAYRRIFERCGLEFRAVEADTGSIGGTASHEFMVLASSGEDDIASCDSCQYAANVEKAEIRIPEVATQAPGAALTRVSTPGQKSVEDVAAFMDVPLFKLVKTLILETDAGELVAALVRGDRELNEIKLCRLLGANEVALASDELVQKITGAPVGFAGPVGLELRILADLEVKAMADFVTGANALDEHFGGVNAGRDFAVEAFADLRSAVAGDCCPRCEGKLQIWRGIEVGHVFKLGTKYSDSMSATVLDAEGKDRILHMGCYGIGIGRTLAAAIEQNHDEQGIIFPMPIAPFQVLLACLSPKDARVMETSERLYGELEALGVEVLFDDRDERPGSKFKDADLCGIPLRITVGAKGLERGVLELKWRSSGAQEEIPLEGGADAVAARVREALKG